MDPPVAASGQGHSVPRRPRVPVPTGERSRGRRWRASAVIGAGYHSVLPLTDAVVSGNWRVPPVAQNRYVDAGLRRRPGVGGPDRATPA